MFKIRQRLHNKFYLLNIKFSIFFFKTLLKKEYLIKIPKSILIMNWITQRLIGINRDVPFSVSYTSRVQGVENIILPANKSSVLISFAVSGGCYFTVFKGTKLIIGEGTLWATNVCIQTGNHGLINRNEFTLKSIIIGRNCWIGNGVAILPGVELGDNVTVGANSTVTKSFTSNSVIGGSPAKILKKI